MKCPSPVSVPDPRPFNSDKSMIPVPCGQCGACKKSRRAEWSFRLKQELIDAKNAFFLTLTYNDDELPNSNSILPTLNKKHLQLYTKRLRKENTKLGWSNLRYYNVGEYGTKTSRPHYHSISFNICPDLVHSLHEFWTYGNVHVGSVGDASIHYVSKFHMNQNTEEIYDENTGVIYERAPEFATMSRRPGIGAGYIDRAKKWHRENGYTHIINDGFPQKMPKYYKDKIFKDFERWHLSDLTIKENFKREKIERERLAKLGIKKPHIYLQKSRMQESKKYKKKSENNGKF